MTKNNPPAAEALPELKAERVLHASIRDAWAAWTDPKRVAVWWGPAGFTSQVRHWDVRPGGEIYVAMKGPDGTVYPMDGSFEAVDAPKRLVFGARALDPQGKPVLENRNEVVFEDLGFGKTRVRLHVRVLSCTQEGRGHLDGMNLGWSMSLDRLEDLFDAGARLASQGVSRPSDKELLFTRVFKFPRAKVWDAWMDPDKVARWWGPEGFSVERPERSVAPGGSWRFIMSGPGGVEFPNKISYLEVEAGRRLVYDHGDYDHVHFRVSVLFEDHAEGTLLSMRFVFPSQAKRDETAVFAVPGNASTLGRLERLLAERAFSISRDFSAPRALVFKAHTDPVHLSQWFSPPGAAVIKAEMDLRPGGRYHYGVRTPDGKEFWGRQTYREVKAPEKLVYVQAFSDKDGGVAPNPFSPVWPREMLSTLTFEDLGGGKTRLTVCWEPLDPTAGEAAAFDAARGDMARGFQGNFSRLEAFLAAE